METRHSRWRKANPEKHRAQQERKRLRRKGLLAPYDRPQKLTDIETRIRNIERMKAFHQSRRERMAADPEYAEQVRQKEREKHIRRMEKWKANPELYAQKLEQDRIRKRIARGIPVDGPRRVSRISDEERARREQEKLRVRAEREAAAKLAKEAKAREKELEAKRKELEKIKLRNIQLALIESQKAARAEQARIEREAKKRKPKPAPAENYKKPGRILALCGWNGL